MWSVGPHHLFVTDNLWVRGYYGLHITNVQCESLNHCIGLSCPRQRLLFHEHRLVSPSFDVDWRAVKWSKRLCRRRHKSLVIAINLVGQTMVWVFREFVLNDTQNTLCYDTWLSSCRLVG